MKKVVQNKWFAISFLFCFTFALLYFMTMYVVKQLHYTLNWQTIAEASAIISVLMVAIRFSCSKKREYENIEHGSSRWGTKKDIAPYIDKDFRNNLIFSKTEFLSMNMRMTGLDLHVFVVGGSGSGKSRFYALVNILQMNASYVITDPSGEHLRNEGKMLEDHGYKVKVFNVINMENSLHFNPLHYYREPEDIIRFIELFIANTSGNPQRTGSNDDFWSNAEKLWFMAHIAYVQETCLEEEKNMNSVVLLLNNSEARDDDEDFKSPVDILFDELEQENPESFAVKQYKKYKLAAGVICSKRLIYHDFCHG
jgi:type IV secretion system protein VirD4